MFLPYADDAPKKPFSPVTHGLILLQAIATLAVMSQRDETLLERLILGHTPTLLDRWAFDPHSPSPLTWFAHLFLHAGLAHFLGNALVLHIVGRPLELRLGAKRFLALFFVAGAVADLALAIATPAPSIGASGAICGLIGAYVVLFPGAYVSVGYTIGPVLGFVAYKCFGVSQDGLLGVVLAGVVFACFQAWTLKREDIGWGETFLGLVGAGRFEVAALWLIGVWTLWQALLAGIQLELGARSGVGYWAHLGGLAAGLAYGFAARKAPAKLAPFATPELTEVAAIAAPSRTATRGTMRLGLKRELAAVLETGAGPSVVHLYTQAEDLGARPVLAPDLQARLARCLLGSDRPALARLALEDLVAAHGSSPEGQWAFRELVALTRPATRRVTRRRLLESHAA